MALAYGGDVDEHVPYIGQILDNIEKRLERWPANKTGRDLFIKIPYTDAGVFNTRFVVSVKGDFPRRHDWPCSMQPGHGEVAHLKYSSIATFRSSFPPSHIALSLISSVTSHS